MERTGSTDADAFLTLRRSEHGALLAQALDVLEADERVAAAWLFGSRGRGDADALSDVDLVIVGYDEHLEALKQERRQLVARLGPPLLIQDLPRNAPPGGAYLLVLYSGESGPLHIDWYWRGLSGSVVPHDALLVIQRSDTELPRQPQPDAPDAEQGALDLARSVIFFWAMAPIAAKYIARRQPVAAFDLLRATAGALDRTKHALELGSDQDTERVARFLTADSESHLLALRQMCEEMEALLPRIGQLHHQAGSLSPEAPAQVRRLLDHVRALIARP